MTVDDRVHVVFGATGGAGGALVRELDAAAGATLVFADNRDGPVDRPMTEDLPARATSKKGQIRALMAERLLAAHRSGTVHVVIGRPSDRDGPGGANSAVGDVLFGAAVQGRRARWLGRLDMPHSLNYLPDVARGLITLASRPDAPGQIWHLPAAEPESGRALVTRIESALGRPVKVDRDLCRRPADRRSVRCAGPRDGLPMGPALRARCLEVPARVRPLPADADGADRRHDGCLVLRQRA